MSLILTQKQLDKLVCSVCDKYLSVLPIKVYKCSAIKCGRCSLPEDDGVVSTYTEVAKNFLFRCVNHYVGCRQLLSFTEVVTHEEKCLADQFMCPQCNQTIESAYELIQHYKKVHLKYLLINNNSFNLVLMDENYEQIYVYVVEDFIFFIYMSFVSELNMIRLSVVSLKDYRGNVFYKFKIKSINYGDTEETKNELCETLETFKDSNYSSFYFGDIVVGLMKIEVVLDLSNITEPVYEVANLKINSEQKSDKYLSKDESYDITCIPSDSYDITSIPSDESDS